MKTGSLFVVATPIGNMSDLSDRAVQTLQKAEHDLSRFPTGQVVLELHS